MAGYAGAGETFQVLLRRHRQAATLSQEALAERAGLSTDAIRVIERGKRGVPRPDTVALLVRALGLEGEARAAFAAAAYAPAPAHPSAAPEPVAASHSHLERTPLSVALTS